MEYRYYEIEASLVAGCRVEDIFSGPKSKEAVLARQLSMVFRMEAYKESQKKVGARYGKDHATCYYAKKAINDFAETNKEFKKVFEDYMHRCYKLKYQLEHKEEFKMKEKLNELGIKEFVRQSQAKLTTLSFILNDFLADNCSDEEVIQAIGNTESTIGELKYIFEV